MLANQVGVEGLVSWKMVRTLYRPDQVSDDTTDLEVVSPTLVPELLRARLRMSAPSHRCVVVD